MKQLTQKQLFVMLNTKNMDLNDPETLVMIADAARYRAALISPIGDAVVGDVFGLQFQAEMKIEHPKLATPMSALALTEAEFRELKLSPTATERFTAVVHRHGDNFAEGCIYCKSTHCVAYKYGESVCGYTD